jgi:hypothetical protein
VCGLCKVTSALYKLFLSNGQEKKSKWMEIDHEMIQLRTDRQQLENQKKFLAQKNETNDLTDRTLKNIHWELF